jgi:hypothetical protein
VKRKKPPPHEGRSTSHGYTSAQSDIDNPAVHSAAGYDLYGIGAEPISQPLGAQQNMSGSTRRAMPLGTHEGTGKRGYGDDDDLRGFRYRQNHDKV